MGRCLTNRVLLPVSSWYIVSCIFIFSLLSISERAYSESNSSEVKGRTYKRKKGFNKTASFKRSGYYNMKVSNGVSVWHQSMQRPFKASRMPLTLGFEITRYEKPYSLFVEGNFLSKYSIDKYELKPYHLSLCPKYYLSGLMHMPWYFDIYGLAGLNVWYTQFVENNYTGITSYKHKVEDDFGVSPIVALGFVVKFNKFEISPKIQYYYGVGQYYAGHFDKQDINVGAAELNVSLIYKFKTGKRCWVCDN